MFVETHMKTYLHKSLTRASSVWCVAATVRITRGIAYAGWRKKTALDELDLCCVRFKGKALGWCIRLHSVRKTARVWC